MQLRNARLCLDCEELHEEQQCPVCASESFAFLARWIPSDENRRRPRVPPKPPSVPTGKLVTGGIAGVALIAAGRWLWNLGRPTATSAVSEGGDAKQVNDVTD